MVNCLCSIMCPGTGGTPSNKNNKRHSVDMVFARERLMVKIKWRKLRNVTIRCRRYLLSVVPSHSFFFRSKTCYKNTISVGGNAAAAGLYCLIEWWCHNWTYSDSMTDIFGSFFLVEQGIPMAPYYSYWCPHVFNIRICVLIHTQTRHSMRYNVPLFHRFPAE